MKLFHSNNILFGTCCSSARKVSKKLDLGKPSQNPFFAMLLKPFLKVRLSTLFVFFLITTACFIFANPFSMFTRLTAMSHV
jgi:hypothetical protein